MSELGSVYEFSSSINEAEAPSPLPIGEYRASVRNIEGKLSKTSGNAMMDITYLVSPDQYPADFVDGDPDGTSLHVYRTLADTKINRFLLRKFSEVHGISATTKLDLTAFVGTEVIIKVTHEEYNGVINARAEVVRAV